MKIYDDRIIFERAVQRGISAELAEKMIDCHWVFLILIGCVGHEIDEFRPECKDKEFYYNKYKIIPESYFFSISIFKQLLKDELGTSDELIDIFLQCEHEYSDELGILATKET